MCLLLVQVLGCSHETSASDLVGRLRLSATAVDVCPAQLRADGVPAVLLSTCHRTELYWWGDADLTEWFEATVMARGGDSAHLEYLDADLAVRHLCSVTAGMRSARFGEPEIMRQVRTAWLTAQAADGSNAMLDTVFRRALEAARHIRVAIGTDADPSLGERVRDVVLARAPPGRHARALDVLVISAGHAARGLLDVLTDPTLQGRIRVSLTSRSDLSAWRAAANDASTGPRELPLRVNASVHTEARRFVSHNFVGVIRGRDPALRDECVVYLGHWDAYGIGPAIRGDSIYNGALDDAAGVSEMLHIAEVVRALPRAPRRTMVFVATTAEERGMRGADAYAARPVCPLPRTALAIGMDWSWTWGLTDTVVSNGFGYSTVDSLAARVATRLGKTFAPGLGEYWLLSDHAALALRGVPAWFGGLDGEVTGTPKGWALRQLAQTRTHGPDGDRKPTWDLSGAVFEVKFLAALGIRAAESATGPLWTVDSEFKRASDASRGAASIRKRPR